MFSEKVKHRVFVSCARHCCVCHKGLGINIEVHHIKPKKDGGDNSFENAIGLCFDCHADAGHYNSGHPKGSKLSPKELIMHRDKWYEIVETNKILPPPDKIIEIILRNEKVETLFTPIFIEEKTSYIDKKSMFRFYELTGTDPMEGIKQRIEDNSWNSPFYMPGFNKIKTFDEYLDFISDDKFNIEDENENIDCQPIKYRFNSLKLTEYKEINRSSCVIDLSIKNVSDIPLEDFKLYLSFENVVNIDSVNKNKYYLDSYNYSYNVLFDEKLKGEFIPEQNVLVQRDTTVIDSICFRTKHDTKEVILKWELFARNIYDKGEIKLSINPLIEEDDRTKYVNSDEVKEPIIRYVPRIDFE